MKSLNIVLLIYTFCNPSRSYGPFGAVLGSPGAQALRKMLKKATSGFSRWKFACSEPGIGAGFSIRSCEEDRASMFGLRQSYGPLKPTWGFLDVVPGLYLDSLPSQGSSWSTRHEGLLLRVEAQGFRSTASFQEPHKQSRPGASAVAPYSIARPTML